MGKRGPKPTPTVILKLRGSDLGDRPDEPQPVSGRPVKPDRFSEAASRAWDWLCEELDEMGLLARSDVTIMALYCNKVAAYWANHDRLDKVGSVLISPKTGHPYMSAFAQVDAMLTAQLLKILAELGLTSSARTRITVTPDAGPKPVQKRNRRA